MHTFQNRMNDMLLQDASHDEIPILPAACHAISKNVRQIKEELQEKKMGEIKEKKPKKKKLVEKEGQAKHTFLENDMKKLVEKEGQADHTFLENDKKLVEKEGQAEKVVEKEGQAEPKKVETKNEKKKLFEKEGQAEPKKVTQNEKTNLFEKEGQPEPKKVETKNEKKKLKEGQAEPKKVKTQNEKTNLFEKEGQPEPKRVETRNEEKALFENEGQPEPKKVKTQNKKEPEPKKMETKKGNVNMKGKKTTVETKKQVWSVQQALMKLESLGCFGVFQTLVFGQLHIVKQYLDNLESFWCSHKRGLLGGIKACLGLGRWQVWRKTQSSQRSQRKSCSWLRRMCIAEPTTMWRPGQGLQF